jgi:hypothetical protein
MGVAPNPSSSPPLPPFPSARPRLAAQRSMLVAHQLLWVLTTESQSDDAADQSPHAPATRPAATAAAAAAAAAAATADQAAGGAAAVAPAAVTGAGGAGGGSTALVVARGRGGGEPERSHGFQRELRGPDPLPRLCQVDALTDRPAGGWRAHRPGSLAFLFKGSASNRRKITHTFVLRRASPRSQALLAAIKAGFSPTASRFAAREIDFFERVTYISGILKTIPDKSQHNAVIRTEIEKLALSVRAHAAAATYPSPSAPPPLPPSVPRVPPLGASTAAIAAAAAAC